jgi:ribonuclease HI
MNQASTSIEVFCDGACSGNPGPGGWGAILRYNGTEKELAGFEADTTNNRMEMLAVITSLETLTRPCQVKITTDSQYVVKGATEWIKGWLKNNWKNSQKKDVMNRDLWERLLAASKPHTVTWHWVKGHAGHAENERCDELARAAILANTRS